MHAYVFSFCVMEALLDHREWEYRRRSSRGSAGSCVCVSSIVKDSKLVLCAARGLYMINHTFNIVHYTLYSIIRTSSREAPDSLSLDGVDLRIADAGASGIFCSS